MAPIQLTSSSLLFIRTNLCGCFVRNSQVYDCKRAFLTRCFEPEWAPAGNVFRFLRLLENCSVTWIRIVDSYLGSFHEWRRQDVFFVSMILIDEVDAILLRNCETFEGRKWQNQHFSSRTGCSSILLSHESFNFRISAISSVHDSVSCRSTKEHFTAWSHRRAAVHHSSFRAQPRKRRTNPFHYSLNGRIQFFFAQASCPFRDPA